MNEDDPKYCTHQACQDSARADLMEIAVKVPTRRAELRRLREMIGPNTLVRHREAKPRPSPNNNAALLAPLPERRKHA